MTETTSSNPPVWTGDNALFENLVTFDEGSIYAACLEVEKVPSVAEQIRNGTPPATALEGAKKKQIPFDALQKIKSNRNGPSDLVYFIARGQSRKSVHGNFSIDPDDRDELFAQLSFLTARGFRYTEKQYGRFRAALGPLIALAVIAGLTLMCHKAAVQMASEGISDISGRRRSTKRLAANLLDFLGPTGVLIVGSLIGLGFLIWLVARMKKPPFVLQYLKSKK